MKTQTKIITPEWAIDVLEKHNPRNRKLSEQTVQSYATDMKNGRWFLNHQGIAFDVNGDLLDGQHRLWAVVLSGKSIDMMVTTDLPVSEEKNGIVLASMDTIDRGRLRQNGQQMQLCHGIKNGAQVAAACRAIAHMIYQSAGNKRISMSTSLLLYELWGKDIESVIGCLESKKRVGHISGPLSMYHHGEPEKARLFCQQMTSLEGMAAPVRAYVKWAEQNHSSGNSEKTSRILSSCILAFHENRSLKKVIDSTNGREFLVGMYPSLARRIREALKPCEIRSIKLELKKRGQAKLK
jgi:hypothetical protein